MNIIKTMAAGAVEGTACGLGKKAEMYDTWNQNSLEETNMNKIKINAFLFIGLSKK